MNWRYSDYLKINQDFIEVFSSEQDEKNAEAWMSFIPHQQMLDLLRALLDALERKTPQPLWMHGQYGTGKTMCLFVLKHLLEDPWETVERYFEAQNVNKNLRDRIKGIRHRGEGLVVYLSGSGHIDSNLTFMASMERAVQRAVEAKGGRSVVGPLFDTVLARLESPAINWPALYEQHRADFVGLANSPEEVIEELRAEATEDQPRFALLDRVVSALQRENVVIVGSPEAMKEWLDAIIATNGYQWIVLMWDEFTEFYRGSVGLDGLQELAQFAAKAPFYLLLATHRPPENLQRSVRAEDWRKIRDRFRTVPYMMEAVTSNRLMSQVIQVQPWGQEQWETAREALWASVAPALRRLRTTDDVLRTADYKGLVPLHPYAAFILSRISQQYSSANRTLFRFMKAPEPHGFPRFIAEYPDDGWHWYTADGLWDFFFGQVEPDTPRDFRDGIGYLESCKGDVDDALQLRALKATILLICLEKALPGEERVRPTLANLGALFTGTPLMERLPQVMEALSSAGLVRAVGSPIGGRVHYTIVANPIDEDEIRDIKKSLGGFGALFGSTGPIQVGVRNAIEGSLPERVRRRVKLAVVSSDDIKHRRERVVPSPLPYQISVVIVIGHEDENVISSREVLQRLAQDSGPVVWVLMSDSFGAERYSQYEDHFAREKYFANHRDDRNARYHAEQGRALMNQWLQSFRTLPFTVWKDRQPAQVSGSAGILSALELAISARYPYRPELILATDPLFKSTGFGVAGAEVGLGMRTKSAPYDQVLVELGSLVAAGKPLQDDVLNLRPNHPLTHMKKMVDQMLAADSLNLKEVWEVLQAPPFGLLPAPISITLFGLLLRECSTGYYYSDGMTSHTLDQTKLAQLIKETMDGRSGYTLQKSSVEERQLCGYLREIFHLNEESSRYLRPTLDAVRGSLVRGGYPFWALAEFMSANARTPYASISDICALVSANDDESYATQERLRQLIGVLSRDRDPLVLLNSPANYEEGMLSFLQSQDDRVQQVLASVGFSMKELMALIKNALEEEVWLWDREEVAQRLPGVLDELEVLASLRELTGSSARTVEAGLASLETMTGRARLPWHVLAYYPDLQVSDVFTELSALRGMRRDYADKHGLARKIREGSNSVVAAINHPAKALRAWAVAVMALDLSEDEAETLFGQLPDLSRAEGDEPVRAAVWQLQSAMERQRAIAELRQAWEAGTGTSSPEAWSEANGLPIGWIVDQGRERQAIDVVQQPERVMVDAVRDAKNTIATLLPRLQGLSVDGAADKRFVEMALGDYATFLERTEYNELDQLRRYLVQSLRKPVVRWTQDEVRRCAVQWIKEQYRALYLPAVMAKLEETPADQLRSLLRGYLHDPLAGLRLLSLEQRDED